MIKSVIVLATLLVCGAIAEEALQRNVLTQPRSQNKIVGGDIISYLDWPSIISLQRGVTSFTHVCGGNILTVNAVLSVAHCFDEAWGTDWSRPALWRARAGTSFHGISGVSVQLSNVVKHQDYNPRTLENDVVLLRLATPLTLKDGIAQAVLPAPGAGIPDGTLARIVGWGATEEGGSNSHVLNVVTVQIINQGICNSAYTNWGGIRDTMICAGWPSGGRDACQGDNGGPLSADGVLYGLSSWGWGCAREGFPGVYSRVSSYTDWIVETTDSI